VHILKHDELVSNIAISSDGKLIATGCTPATAAIGSVALWDARTGKRLKQLTGHNFAIAGLAFTADDKYLLSAGIGGSIRVTRTATGEDVSEIVKLDFVTGFYLLGGKLVACEDKQWSVWDVSDPRKPKRVKDAPSRFGSGSSNLSRDGALLVGWKNSVRNLEFPAEGPAEIWVRDVRREKVLIRFKSNLKNNVMGSIRLSNDKKLMAISYVFGPDNLQVRQVQDGKLLFQGAHPDLPACLTFSPDGKYFAVGSVQTGMLHVWSVSDKVLTKKLKAHEGTVQDIAFSPDGAFLMSASADQTVKVWKFADLK
jgi:WD40 repeat protein